MHDRNLKYVDLYMLHEDLTHIDNYELPLGYGFQMYRKGEEIEWARIIHLSGEVESVEIGLEKFKKYYGGRENELENRCLFILDKNTGEKVGTATAWMVNHLNEQIPNITGNLHWVSIIQSHKGKALSKPMITKAMKLMFELGHRGAYLHTQTHTWVAAKIYLSLGWVPTRFNLSDGSIQDEKIFEEGWKIVQQEMNKI